MATRRFRSLFLALLVAAGAGAPPAAAQEAATATDDEGDAGGKDQLDILRLFVEDDGVEFSVSLETKDLPAPGDAVDPAHLHTKLGYLVVIEAANATDSGQARAVFVLAQVTLLHDESASQPPGTASGVGTSFMWGIYDGATPVRQGKITGATLDATAGRVQFTLGFDKFNVGAGGASRVDLSRDGVVTNVRAETLDSPHPYYAPVGDVSPWDVVDTTPDATYALSRIRAAPPEPEPEPKVNETDPLQNETDPANATAVPTNATASGTDAANGTAASDGGATPAPGFVVATAAAALAAALHRRGAGRGGRVRAASVGTAAGASD